MSYDPTLDDYLNKKHRGKMKPSQKLAIYAQGIHFQARNLLMQADPATATSEGLDDILTALGLRARRWETRGRESDDEVRKRIYHYLGWT